LTLEITMVISENYILLFHKYIFLMSRLGGRVEETTTTTTTDISDRGLKGGQRVLGLGQITWRIVLTKKMRGHSGKNYTEIEK